MKNQERRPDDARICVAGLVHLVIVYFLWGSTYLAIRIAVKEGAGFPPFWMGFMRVVVAGALLMVGARIAGMQLRPSRSDWWTLAISGILLWVGGNGAVIWAEQRADSGYAALLVGSLPLWVALMESILDRRPPSALLAGSLLSGFAGLVVLSLPALRTGTKADLLSVAALLFAPMSWGAGMVLQRRRPVSLTPLVSSVWQHLIGGAGFLACVLIAREPLPTPTPAAWAAWGYLVVFGSVVAFTSFVYALKLLPTSISTTYAYVNPVIAVLLGWMILSEEITWVTIAGSVLIMVGVAGAFRSRS